MGMNIEARLKGVCGFIVGGALYLLSLGLVAMVVMAPDAMLAEMASVMTWLPQNAMAVRVVFFFLAFVSGGIGSGMMPSKAKSAERENLLDLRKAESIASEATAKLQQSRAALDREREERADLEKFS